MSAKKQKLSHRALIIWFIKHRFRKQFLQITLLALLAALLSTPIPFIYRTVIDGIDNLPGRELLGLVILYVVLIILEVLVDYWKQIILITFNWSASFSLATEIYRTLIKLPYHISGKRSSADLIKLLGVDSDALQSAIVFGTTNMISLLIRFVIDLVVMYILFGWGILGVIVVLPVYYLLIKKSVKNMEEYDRAHDDKREIWFDDSYSPLYRLKEVKSRRLENFLLENIRKSNQDVCTSGVKAGRAGTLLYSFYDFFDKGVYVILFLVGVYGVIKGHLTLGTLFAIFYVSSSIISKLNSLCLAISDDYHRRIPSLDRVAELYATTVDNPQKQPPDLPALKVEFEKVKFAYPESKFELSIPSLTLSDNRKYVLVGRTGSGKSTLFDLLNGIMHSQEGSILINGTKTTEIAEEWWKKNCFVLLQDSYIFRGTIEDNILLGDTNLQQDLDKLIAEQGFASFFERFTDGIKTNPKEGKQLSGGEKRMVCLLRLLLKQQYQMILVDEGKTGLDAELRVKIDDLMQEVVADRLSLTITHDLDEITRYDEVLFVSEGTVIQDQHENLMANNEDYRDLLNAENNHE
ncbi:MAG TPA: ABC transporter ATP-binding protein [Candidatus Cloacimonadota bacterium]|nr:ABC transporter ATP-binding protein [Candidatus Cloacimonadota bacterium]